MYVPLVAVDGLGVRLEFGPYVVEGWLEVGFLLPLGVGFPKRHSGLWIEDLQVPQKYLEQVWSERPHHRVFLSNRICLVVEKLPLKVALVPSCV